jgi:hypothetical protein
MAKIMTRILSKYAASRFVIAFRSLRGFAKPDCGFALQRKEQQSSSAAKGVTLSPVRFKGTIREVAAISRGFAVICSQVSLQFRLRGGEAGIRTLGTGVSPYNGLAIVCSLAMPSNPNYLQSHSLTKSDAM